MMGRVGVHMHASVSDAKGCALAAHLMPSCVARMTAEIVVAQLLNRVFGREVDPLTGFHGTGGALLTHVAGGVYVNCDPIDDAPSYRTHASWSLASNYQARKIIRRLGKCQKLLSTFSKRRLCATPFPPKI